MRLYDTDNIKRCGAVVAVVMMGALACSGGGDEGSSWYRVSNAGPWGRRQGQDCVEFKGKIWLLGGQPYNVADVWNTVDGTNWTLVLATAPWGVQDQRCVVFNDALWLLGGEQWGNCNSNVWVSVDGSNWTAAPRATWGGRSHHEAVVFNNNLWVIGGNQGSFGLDDVWSSADGTNWSSVIENAPWGCRYEHQVVVMNGTMWLIGGYRDSNRRNDVWSSPDGTNWTLVTAAAEWSARSYHQSVVFDDRLWVLGGVNTSGYPCSDVWSSFNGSNWFQATSGAQWPARGGHSSLVFNDQMWVIAGATNSVAMGTHTDVWLSVTIPGIAITNPASSSALVTNGTITLSGISSSAQVVGWLTQEGSNGLATGTSDWVAADIPVPTLSNRITVWAVSAHGGTATVGIVVFNDPALPVVQNAAVTPLTSGVGVVTISLTFSKLMDTAAAVSVNYLPNNQVFAGCYQSLYTWTGAAPVTTGADGVKDVTVAAARDMAGIGLADTNGLSPFLVDTTAPDAPTPEAPLDQSYSCLAAVALGWRLGTDVTGVVSIEIATNAGSAVRGPTNGLTAVFANCSTNTWSVRSWDAYGNTSLWSALWTVYVDTNRPVITLLTPLNGSVTNGVPELAWSASGFAPVTAHVVTVDCTAYEAGMSNVFTPLIVDGTHSWSVTSYNLAGSTGTSPVWQFQYDLVAPLVADALVAPLTAGVGRVNLQVTFNERMRTATPVSVQAEPDGIGANGAYQDPQVWTGSLWIASGVNGAKSLAVSGAEDAAGNAMAATNGLASFIADTTPPDAPTPTAPPDRSCHGEPTVLLEWLNGTDAYGLARVQLGTNGGTVALCVTNQFLCAASSGTNTWRIRTFDDAGNTSAWSATWTFFVDTAAPRVTLIGPASGLITNQFPTLLWSVAGLAPVSNNTVVIDGIAYAAGLSTAFTMAVAEATHAWQVVSVNILGTQGASATNGFIYDATPPVTAGAGSIDGMTFHRGVNTLRVDVVDVVSGVDWAELPEVRLAVGAWPAVRVYHLAHTATQWIGQVYVPHYYGDGPSSVEVTSLRDHALNNATASTMTDAITRACAGADADVPGGFFTMGSMENADEQPTHDLYIGDFYLDRYEVANEAFAQFVEAGGYTNAPLWSAAGWFWRVVNNVERPLRWTNTVPMWVSDTYSDRCDTPVVGISWYEAEAFAHWVGRSLPTEAQWEYAARLPDNRGYTWGNNFWLDQIPPTYLLANWFLGFSGYVEAGYTNDGASYTAREASYPPSEQPLALYDLMGNANEWVADWYAGVYATNIWVNPTGPPAGTYKLLRGGSFISGKDAVRCPARMPLSPGTRSYDTGFRTAVVNTHERPPAIGATALIFPSTNGCEIVFDAVTNIVWRPARIYDNNDAMNVLISRMTVLDTALFAEVEIVDTDLSNSLGCCTWGPTNLVPGVNYVLQVEVRDHAGLETNKVFISNVFRAVPEPMAAMLLLMGCALARLRRAYKIRA